MNILKKGMLVLLGLALGVAAQAATEPSVNYVYNDHLGTPRVVVNSANKVIWQNEGEPFGNAAPQEDPDGDGVKYTLNLRFPGQYYDSESGRNQNYYRDYNPATGRYIQSDPIGLGGGINTFGYAEEDPTMKNDPLGLATFMCTKPLHGLGDTWGPRLYPESSWNPSPTYHQFLCVKDASGKNTCGGQDRTGAAFFPGSPGKPSDDSWPESGNGSCEQRDGRDCVDQCVIAAISNPKRPRYAIGPHGTDCQEWADEVLITCKARCRNRRK